MVNKKPKTREKKTVAVEKVKKDPPLLTKPKKYKLNDIVKVNFLDGIYVAKIVEVRHRTDLWPQRWMFRCIVVSPSWAKGTKLPTVGIGKSEEDMNIVELVS